MRCSLSLLVSLLVLAGPTVGLAQSRFNVGTPLSQEEIKSFDFMIGPEGQQLPPGHGTAAEGAVIFANRCAVCHGQNGQGGIVRRLVIGSPGHPHQGTFNEADKDGVSYYPFPTIAWDYINRAMPASKPGSLTPDEVYAVVPTKRAIFMAPRTREAFIAAQYSNCRTARTAHGPRGFFIASNPTE